jgi:hypothetical protein
MIDLELAQHNRVEFDIAVSGMSNMTAPIISFAIFANDIKYVFSCARERNVDGKNFVDIPNIDLPEGQYPCQFEILIGDRFYVPHKDIVKFGANTIPEISIKVPGIDPVNPEKPPVVKQDVPKDSPKSSSMFKSFEAEPKKKEVDLTVESKMQIKIEPKKVAALPPRKTSSLTKTSEVVLGQEINNELHAQVVEVTHVAPPKQKPTLIKKDIIL